MGFKLRKKKTLRCGGTMLWYYIFVLIHNEATTKPIYETSQTLK